MSCVSVEQNMTISSVNKLLRILSPYHPELPLDARTLLQTSKNKTVIRDMGNGRYCHLGLMNGLILVQNQLQHLGTEPIQLLFNIDGLPITKGIQKKILANPLQSFQR